MGGLVGRESKQEEEFRLWGEQWRSQGPIRQMAARLPDMEEAGK